MVAGLITYYKLSTTLVNIQMPSEDFSFTNGEKFNTSDWNPLLYAVANKQTEIVRYFLEEVKLSLKSFSRKSREEGYNEAERATVSTFALQIAVSNKDAGTLEELWSYH